MGGTPPLLPPPPPPLPGSGTRTTVVTTATAAPDRKIATFNPGRDTAGDSTTAMEPAASSRHSSGLTRVAGGLVAPENNVDLTDSLHQGRWLGRKRLVVVDDDVDDDMPGEKRIRIDVL